MRICNEKDVELKNWFRYFHTHIGTLLMSKIIKKIFYNQDIIIKQSMKLN